MKVGRVSEKVRRKIGKGEALQSERVLWSRNHATDHGVVSDISDQNNVTSRVPKSTDTMSESDGITGRKSTLKKGGFLCTFTCRRNDDSRDPDS